MTDKTYTELEVQAIILDQIKSIGWCLGELGFSKEHIKHAYARCAEEYDAKQGYSGAFNEEVWFYYDRDGDTVPFNELYRQLPDQPDEGRVRLVQPRPMEEFPLEEAKEELKKRQETEEAFKEIAENETLW